MQQPQPFEIAARAYHAARRALGLVNKLTPGETKHRHAKRVMALLNKWRAEFTRLAREQAAGAHA